MRALACPENPVGLPVSRQGDHGRGEQGDVVDRRRGLRGTNEHPVRQADNLLLEAVGGQRLFGCCQAVTPIETGQ